MSYRGKREIVTRIESIAGWRRERGIQDQFGFGPDVAARHQRSAEGLDGLAKWIDTLPEDDSRLERLEQVAFRGEFFDPGAVLLNEIGRFRFHDPTTSFDAFLDQMIGFAETDRAEEAEFGGPQVDGDNPWRADFEIRVLDDGS
jgi:hypothetical protein